MLRYCLVFVLALGYPQQESPKTEEHSVAQREAHLRYERFRQQSIRINELAGSIKSEADARALVDSVAELFADQLPPSWATIEIRERIAHAEYEAVADPMRQIPEQRIADVWNKYVREIGASEEAIVTAAEIHNMRDGMFATGQVLWSRGSGQNAWTMPNIYAVGGDGKVAEGCRAVEALRVLYDFNQMFDNVRSARQRVRKGIVVSDLIRKSLENRNPNQKATGRLEGRVIDNPLWTAERRYVNEHGAGHLSLVVEMLSEELFPASQQANSKVP
jgi:hypothetical protein